MLGQLLIERPHIRIDNKLKRAESFIRFTEILNVISIKRKQVIIKNEHPKAFVVVEKIGDLVYNLVNVKMPDLI